MSVLLPGDEHAHIRELAKAMRISANEWVRRAVAVQFAFEVWMQSGQRPEAERDDPSDPS
jgi:hypothetical protein